MKHLKDWNPARVKAAIAGSMVQNMAVAASFALEQAKARVPVRKGNLRRNLIFEIEARGDVIEGRIGARKKFFQAFFLEVGTSKLRARPFLRPAVFGNAATILRMLRGEM